MKRSAGPCFGFYALWVFLFSFLPILPSLEGLIKPDQDRREVEAADLAALALKILLDLYAARAILDLKWPFSHNC